MSSHGDQGGGAGKGSDAVQPGGERSTGAGRKPYRAPRLVVHGSVRELTLGGHGASPDVMNKQRAKKPKKK